MYFYNDDNIKAKLNQIITKSHFYHSVQNSTKNSPNKNSSMSSDVKEKDRERDMMNKFRSSRSFITNQTSDISPSGGNVNTNVQSLFQSQSQPDSLLNNKKLYIDFKNKFRPKDVNKFIASKNKAFESLQLLALMDDNGRDDSKSDLDIEIIDEIKQDKSDIIIPKLDFGNIFKGYKAENLKIAVARHKSKYLLNISDISSSSITNNKKVENSHNEEEDEREDDNDEDEDNDEGDEEKKKKEHEHKHHHHHHHHHHHVINGTEKKNHKANLPITNYQSPTKKNKNTLLSIDGIDMKQIFSDLYDL